MSYSCFAKLCLVQSFLFKDFPSNTEVPSSCCICTIVLWDNTRLSKATNLCFLSMNWSTNCLPRINRSLRNLKSRSPWARHFGRLHQNLFKSFSKKHETRVETCWNNLKLHNYLWAPACWPWYQSAQPILSSSSGRLKSAALFVAT